jgi:hypothetical protein
MGRRLVETQLSSSKLIERLESHYGSTHARAD